MRSVSVVVVVLVCMFFACGKVDPNLLPTQHKSIESYLSKAKVTGYNADGGVYWFAANVSRDTYADDPVAMPGDSVYYYFEQYVFTTEPQQPCIYTNKSYILEQDTIINPQYWPLDAIGVKVGSTKMIAGLAQALPYCHQGDSLVVIMSTDAAYGAKDVGVVPANSALMLMLNIETVKNF